ncbi:Uncharacterized protein FKW44_017897 [Caligus rogercresseyi]|uniref:Transposase Synechocystis PCC 6803 domain-containing protein n=1 Tax=Caligus rogercresseyi TaxID=217165 RepID=A0A7T8GTN3_CALRO|nr:Uncharacterized protein FKW44_017897 [Caligus rogercresseyi]
MASQQDTRVAIRARLDAGKTPTEISNQLGVTRHTVYTVKKSESVERNPGSGRKAKLDPEGFKKVAQATPLKSMRAHARELGVSPMTVHRTVKKAGGKSLVRVERPLLKDKMKETHLQRCKALLYDMVQGQMAPLLARCQPLDYTFWVHVKRKACNARHPNITQLKATVNEHWDAMTEGYLRDSCRAFRGRLKAIIAAGGGYIDD